MCEPQLPLAIQLYLWRLLKPFLRAKLGRVHEASCWFCQRAPAHHQEMKEACSAMERVLVQNIQNDAAMKQAFSSVPRWRLIQASLPYVLHAAASVLTSKKDFQNLGPLETTLLYILHWSLLDAADECADQDGEVNNPFYYLFSISTMTLFVYLFIPLVNHLKDIDFKGSLRLENGQKIWYPIYECRHPEATCFTAHCRPKPRALWKSFTKSVKSQNVIDDVFVGTTDSPPQNAGLTDQPVATCTRGLDDDGSWVSSPKDKAFPETIPEESSSTEDEHVVIFTLPSLDESERMLDGVKQVSTIYAGEASIFHVAMGRRSSCTKPTLTIEQVTAISDLDSYRQYEGRPKARKLSDAAREKDDRDGKHEKDKGADTSKTKGDGQRYPSSGDGQSRLSAVDMDVRAATFFDVAVIRCLFISQWQEEGIFWALQFVYNRLRRINEEISIQQMPRRRSNSLPIPKIEVSIYQSPESKKREDGRDVTDSQEIRDSVLSADVSSYGDVTYKTHDTEISHTRRASEKTKKRMKMADLKAFVETKLLSKSEKALEKIGQEEPKTLFEQECHRSLDAGEKRLTRQPSVCSKIFDAKDPDYIEHPTNLIKGKSMPSLRYIGDTKVDRKDSRICGQSCPAPIITVTEHTPTPSPEYMKRQGSVDSQLDVMSSQARKTTCDRKPSLTRSQTDSNITYTGDDMPEAPGSSYFITKDGDIDLEVILKAVHNISQRDSHSCSLRVCESILNLLELLMDMGVLKHCLREESMENNPDSPEKSEGDKKQGSGADSASRKEGRASAHNLMTNCVVNIVRHLGCPHGCLDGIRGPQADFCRSQIQTIFNKLHKASSKQFATFLRELVRERRISSVVEFFHSYIGFCVDPSSLLSPLNQKRGSSKSPDTVPQGGYATNFGAGTVGGTGGATGSNNTPNSSGSGGTATGYPSISGFCHRFRSIESQIVGCVFKAFVTRCVEMLGKLKSQDSISLYCDIRQFVSYVKEAHGGAFRRVALSAILDSADRPGKKPNSEIQTTKVIRHLFPWEIEQNVETGTEGCYTIDDSGSRKFLIKKRSTSSTCASLLETELSDENVKVSQSPSGNIRKRHHTLTPRQSERNLDLSEPSFGIRKSRKTARLRIGGIVNWFRKEYGRSDTAESHESSESPTEYSFARQPSLRRTHRRGISRAPRGVGRTLQKAKRRMEDKLSRIGLVKGKKKEKREEVRGSYFSRRGSVEQGDPSRESEFVVLKERRLVPKKAVFEGIQRFAFLLETCQPGSVPDHHLMAALLDLPFAPVVARAAMLLECAHLVHQCNKGHWPNWMKLNFPTFRPSMAMNSRSAPTGIRRTHALQRAAGKLFYQWAEAIGARLEEFLAQDRRNYEHVCNMMLDESKQKDLAIEDVEEDFFDEASVNTYGSSCPVALRLVACNLLLEITAFLRETYPNLPKSSRLSTKERAPPWEKLYSREANRRWSMALSSMGHSQTSAQSLQSIAGDRETERKISFVLHEPDNESEGSSKSNVTIQGEDLIMCEKEKAKRMQTAPGRPFLLRRGTTTNAATGSFKRRSLKLRRNTKEGKEIEVEAFRRADSIQSKRKVSSLSDRSDTSEPGLYGEVSGEESPGILSDDQPPESPSDSNDTDELNKSFPWMRVVVQTASNFNFVCCHQNHCHPYCHRRQMRAGERLVRAVRKVYGEEVEFEPDSSLFDLEAASRKADAKKDKRSRKVSEQASLQVSPVRRKDSVGRKFRGDKSFDGSQSGALPGEAPREPPPERDCDYGQDFLKYMQPPPEDERGREPPPMLRYLREQVRDAFQAPLATLLKGAVVMPEELFIDVLPVAWELLLELNQEVAAAAASMFIVASVRAPTHAVHVMREGLRDERAGVRINSVLRFQALWKFRFQAWPRMEEAAHVTFKVPPPGIEFTLPSPKIGIESLPVVDPPWMPQVKTKVEEVTINQERHRALVTATKTRKKQQTEAIRQALQAQDDKKREERANFLITTIPITFQAAYEPSPVGDDHDEANMDEDAADMAPRNLTHHGQSAPALFPSTLCSATIQIITLLDDPAVAEDGTAVYDVAYQVIWNCLVEDSALFLRYILERLTREKQDLMFKHLRHLIRFVPKLPQQAAFALYNYIIGYIMFYVRTPHEEGQEFIGSALSILWMVVHSVHGIMFKDLKQILRKEQCDASILLTANVPSAKKIIVHGPQDPDAGGIPSQFPVQEDTQFCQILRESLDFFGIEESKHKEYFLVDHKTHQIHNPSSYVRDYYFFKRSQYPQLELVHMQPEDAFNALQRQELVHKFVETGKVMLTWAILKNVDMVVQRVVFLHEELMKLPSFPRKALEADLDLYKGGELGKELLALDVMHKFMWVRLIARMFEAMAGNFAYSGDIHLFLNVLNGALILHSEDSCILRYVVATYINAAHNFKNIFSTNGYFLIMPALLQLYSTHQTNKLVTTTVEYAVKQFYLMNRKPFILQMFGSVSAILDTDESSVMGEAHKVPSSCLFNLLLSLETPSPDPLNIGELVKEDKPLKAIDFCYHDEDEMVTILDCISLCVMTISYAADSVRGQQMLVILEAIMPCYVQQIQLPTYNKEGKTEKEIINQLAIAMRTLVNNAEALAKYYNRPQKSSPEHKGSSQRNYGKGPCSPGFDFDEEAQIGSKAKPGENEESESHKNEFVRPRDTLLNMVGEFVQRASARLVELNKKSQDGKGVELLDSKCHVRLAEIAHSLLKISPYDPEAMACRGLKRYMSVLLPSTEWSNDDMRPALILILRRLDKTFSKIYKKASIRRNTNWEAASALLKGVYETLMRCPYIAHLQNLKALLATCQSLITGDTAGVELTSAASAALMSKIPPQRFCSTVLKLIALQVISLGEGYSLENICGHAMFATASRAENVLLNLLIPLFLRVGTGRKHVPKLRQSDICFALTAVLNVLWPTGAKTMQSQAPTLKTAADIRAGSLTFAAREAKNLTKTSTSLYQVAFLALKIIVICYESELRTEWPRILRTMRLLNKRNEASLYLWNFIEFVVTHRTPLYIQMMPFIIQKIGQAPISEHERNMHGVIRDKIEGRNLGVPKCRGALLMDLFAELSRLKDEIDERKFDEMQPEPKRSMAEAHGPGEGGGQPGAPRTQRPSLLIDLLTGDLGSRARTPAETPCSNSSLTAASSAHHSHSSASNATKVSLQSQLSAGQPLASLSARGSISSTSAGSGTLREATDAACPGSSKADQPQATGETMTSQLSPSSPNEDSSGECRPDKPRLQRSMGQSKRTFRLKKSRRAHAEMGPAKLQQTDGCLSPPDQQEKQQLREQLLREQPREPPPEPQPLLVTPGEPGARSRRSSSARQGEAGSGVGGGGGSGGGGEQLQAPQHHLQVRPQSDISWDEDTSSTSGYRESYSMQLVSLESSGRRAELAPPLASPDLPSTSSTTTNCMAFDGSSPECSINSNGAERTALLTQSSPRTGSQHSLLMLGQPPQDEDTLI